MAEHPTVAAVSKARSAMEAEEQALLRLRTQADLYRTEQPRLHDEIRTIEAERRAALAGDGGRPVAEIVGDLTRKRGELQEATVAIEELGGMAREAEERLVKAEKVLTEALDTAWAQRYDEASKALADAISRLAPAVRAAALECGIAWPSLTRMLETIARDADLTSYPPPAPPKALLGSTRSALLTEEVRRAA